MSSAVFVCCPDCDRIMLGQRDRSGHVYPQPHECEGARDE